MKYLPPYIPLSKLLYLTKLKEVKTGLLSIICMFFIYSTSIAQQVPVITDMSYNITESNTVLLPQGTTFEDIHPYNIPSIKRTEKSLHYRDFVDQNDNPQTEVVLTNAVNCHTESEGLADKWTINQDGVTLYRKGLKSSYSFVSNEPHNGLTFPAYSAIKTRVTTEGYLSTKVYPTNIAVHLTNSGTPYGNLGNGIIMIKDGTSYTIFNDNAPRKITRVEYDNDSGTPPDPTGTNYPPFDDPEVTSVEVSTYREEICGQFFLSSTITTSKDDLLNDICAKVLNEKYYSDYQFSCPNSAIAKLGNPDADTYAASFSIFPNPLNSDLMTLELGEKEREDDQVTIIITTLDGKQLMKLNGVKTDSQITFSVGSSLQQDGLYLLSIKGKKHLSTRKFYYLNN